MDRFINTRVRLSKSQGGRCFGGWFAGTNGSAFVVELSSDEALAPGELVRMHAVSADCQAELETQHLATQGRNAAFAMPEFIRITYRDQLPRYRSKGAKVSLVTPNGVFRADDVDISVGGFGFTCQTAMDVGQTAKVVYRCPEFEGTFEVECRHCRHVPEVGFHIGVKLTAGDRALNGKWTSYISSVHTETTG